MKKSRDYVFIIVLSLFLLTACQPKAGAGNTPQGVAAALKAVQTGTAGVEVHTLPNYPPSTIYDQNGLTAIVEVKNRGNYDLEPQNCFIQVTGFDPNIILGGLEQPRSCAESTGTLEGKNVYNTEGGVNQIEFKSQSIALPPGVFEYNPKLNFVTCYNYHTIASPSVCVDPLLFQITPEQKTCIPRSVGMGGGQGGPIGVSSVGVDMIGSKAIFEINVMNYGSGKVLSSLAVPQNCGDASLSYQDFDKVMYNVQMTGGSLIDCKPRDGIVRLTNNQGKIICSFNIPGTSAYETPLLIDLDYGYIQSFSQPVRIIKTPE